MTTHAEPSPAIQLAGSTVFSIEIEGQPHRVELLAGEHGSYQARVDGQAVNIDVQLVQPGVISLIHGGRVYRCVLQTGPVESAIQIADKHYVFTMEDRRSLSASRGKRGGAGGSQIIKAPMPGRVVRVLVAPGDELAAHQGVIVIEAMKMQNELKTPRAGKVVSIQVAAGDTVSANDKLIVIE